MKQIDVAYDAGYFDKDEQGWCSRHVAITQTGTNVVVRQWGDDNGARPYDQTLHGQIASVSDEVVTFAGDLAKHVFDLKTRQLTLCPYQIRSFVPPSQYSSDAGFLRATAALVVGLAAALEGESEAVPALPGWPPVQPSETCEGATESWLRLPLERGGQLLLMHRVFGVTHQLCVEIRGIAQVFVWGMDGGHVLYNRPATANARAERLIDEWQQQHLRGRPG